MAKYSASSTAFSESFYRPPVPAGYIARPHLCQRLNSGLQGRLILLCAPAGFGKSALLSEFCDQLDSYWSSVWLSLSERDADLGRFFERFLNALHSIYAGAARQALAVLQTRQSHQAFPYEAWLNDALDEVSRHLNPEAPVLFVLDDYHLAQNEGLDSHLQYLLNHLPAGLRVLVSSRQRPSWHLARWRLTGSLLELGESDLRFQAHELDTLLVEQGYCQLTQSAVENILSRSEGWIAGLRLWLLAVNGRTDNEYALLAGPHGGQGLIREYLLEEIIAQQSEAVKDFLLVSACFERFNASLCDALRGSSDSRQQIAYLLEHQVFLVPLDEQGDWYRYHHLFSDALQTQQPTASELRRLYARASSWFAEQGMLSEAVEYALLAEQPDVAAALVQESAEELLLAEQNISLLLRWKMNLPDSVLSSTPRLLILYCWALGLACQLDAADQLLRQLGKFLPAPTQAEQQSLLAQWQALTGLLARGRGDAELAWQSCNEALPELPAERYGQRHMCLSVLNTISIARDNILQARQLTRDSVELAQRTGCRLYTALALYDRARVLQIRGQIHRALAVVADALQLLVHLPRERVYAVRGRLTMYQGYLLGMRGQVQTASLKLEAGINEAQACRDTSVLIGYRMQAVLDGSHGYFSEAFEQLTEAERIMHQWDVPSIYYLAMLTLSKCELWLQQGQAELARPWLERLSATYNVQQRDKASEFHPQLALYVELQMALLECALGQSAEAEQRLTGLITYTHLHGCAVVEQAARVHLSMLLLEQGRSSASLHEINQALQLSQGGAILAFQPLINQHAEWFRSVLLAYPQSAERDELLAALPDETKADAIVATQLAPYEALSARELAVLQLIAQGCSNQEICDQLFISLHTVKTHARKINQKLAVERRTQAVARAQALGLLS